MEVGKAGVLLVSNLSNTPLTYSNLLAFASSSRIMRNKTILGWIIE